MANATVKNAVTYSGAQVFSSTVTVPKITISDSNSNVFMGLSLPTSLGNNNIVIGNANVANLSSGAVRLLALGQQAFPGLGTGTDVIAIGHQSGASAADGTTRCTFIGPLSGALAFSSAFTDSTAIGSGATITASNQLMLGTSAETVVFPGNATFNVNLPTSTQVPSTGDQLVNKTYTDATYATISGTPTLSGSNAWTGSNTYNSALPTSTQTPTTSAQLVTKVYVDSTYVALSGDQTIAGIKTFSSAPVMSGASITSGTIPAASVSGTAGTLGGANVWTSTNVFNANLPTSTQVPTTGSQLVNKTYTDATYVPTTLVPNVVLGGTVTSSSPYTVAPLYVANQAGTLSSQLMNVLFASSGEPNITTINLGNAQSFGINWSTTLLTNYALTSISGPNIINMTQLALAASLGNLTTFSFPNVVTIGSSGFNLTAAALTTVSMPLLKSSGFTFILNCTLLTSLDLSSFSASTSGTTITLPALTTFSMASFAYVGANLALTLAAATTVTLTSLSYVVGTFALTAATLTTFSLPALTVVGSTFTITAANMTTFSMNSGLLSIGGNFTMSGMALDQASVDGILVRLAALDGTGGTTAYSSKTVALNGGTNATPSATGLTAKATLVGRGCTVNNN